MKKPNVILLFVDDLGIGDLSCFNENSKIQTPNIDAIAKKGMKFTDSHACSSVCSPSRYGLLTGRYNFRSKLKYSVLSGDSMPLIEKNRMTLGHLFQKQGYKTACVGKWHLGLEWVLKENSKDGGLLCEEYLYDNIIPRNGTEPTLAPLIEKAPNGLDVDYTQAISYGVNEFGFDYFFGMAASLDQPPFVYIENNRVTDIPNAVTGELVLDRLGGSMQEKWQSGVIAPSFDHSKVLIDMNDKVLSLIDDYAQEEEPFFIYYPTPAVHGPLLPSENFRGKSGLNLYADVVLELDHMVGQITEKLREKGLEEDTIFIFTSDNGCSGVADLPFLESKGHFSSEKFKGHKFSIYEGGHRVPTIISYPNMIEKDSVCENNVCHTDFFATFAEFFQVETPEASGEDSFSNLALWQGKNTCQRKSSIYSCGSGYLAVLQNQWKLTCCCDGGMSKEIIENTYENKVTQMDFELYNMETDPEEKHNLMSQYPEIADSLVKELDFVVYSHENQPSEQWFQRNW